MIDIGGSPPEKFSQGGWIFADTTSALWPEIQTMLLPSTTLNISRQGHDSYQYRIGKGLGYPVRHYPRRGEWEVIMYEDETERQALVAFTRKGRRYRKRHRNGIFR
jgi:hypothetical protein